MEQLKNCPFCGGKAKDLAGKTVIDNANFWRVYCRACGCRTGNLGSAYGAADAWNRRTLPHRSEAVLIDLANGVISVGDAMELLEGMK